MRPAEHERHGWRRNHFPAPIVSLNAVAGSLAAARERFLRRKIARAHFADKFVLLERSRGGFRPSIGAIFIVWDTAYARVASLLGKQDYWSSIAARQRH